MVLDGKTFAESTMVVALGITLTGEKRFLGFVETDTENAQVLTPLRSLVERGLDISQGVLVRRRQGAAGSGSEGVPAPGAGPPLPVAQARERRPHGGSASSAPTTVPSMRKLERPSRRRPAAWRRSKAIHTNFASGSEFAV